MKYHVSLTEVVEQLAKEKDTMFVPAMQHGAMRVEYYAPLKVDAQTPHKQDELYVICSGEATFNRNDEKIACKKGDVLFVPAGMKHHFEEFSDDFSTWVIFYGEEKEL